MIQNIKTDEEKSNLFHAINDKKLFPDLPLGPLDRYREKATFDYRKLTILLDSERYLRFQNKIWNFMEESHLFVKSYGCKKIDEQQEITVRRLHKLIGVKFVKSRDYIDDVAKLSVFISAVLAYDPSLSIKINMGILMFSFVLRVMGTERLIEYADDAEEGRIQGCFALTEVSHGSNALGMKTTATYDIKNRQFVINSPDFEAAKCWIGNMGKTCTHAIVYAQLYSPDGQHHGLNGFLVPIRDTKTLKPFAGVTVGDLGEKIGLNGLDNGFVMFNNFRIPKENLLARLGDVYDDGQFLSPITNNRKRMGASFAGLSGGRVMICGISNVYLIKAISIAIRYSASRVQFKDNDADDELPIIEYQSQQNRLLPHLATAVVQKVFTFWFTNAFTEFSKGLLTGEVKPILGNEIHALSSATKPVCTWAARDAVQDCREACGGLGYLKIAGFGDLRNDNDPNCTYEGENNVLLQQTSKWLVGCRKNGFDIFNDVSPLKSAQFLSEYDTIIQRKCNWNSSHEALDPNNILSALDWLVAWLLEKTYQHSSDLRKKQMSKFEIQNNMQVFHAQTLSIVYGQRAIYKVFVEFVENQEKSAERNVLERIASLYGSNLILHHIGLFYEGGFITSGESVELIKSGFIDLLSKVKCDAIPLVDTIAPNDFILNSPLGMQDGQVYKHLQSILWQTPSTFERPKWYQLITKRNSLNKSKL